MNYTVFTVCNLAYIGKALTLADSLFTATGNKLNIFIIDRKNEEVTNKKRLLIFAKLHGLRIVLFRISKDFPLSMM